MSCPFSSPPRSLAHACALGGLPRFQRAAWTCGGRVSGNTCLFFRSRLPPNQEISARVQSQRAQKRSKGAAYTSLVAVVATVAAPLLHASLAMAQTHLCSYRHPYDSGKDNRQGRPCPPCRPLPSTLATLPQLASWPADPQTSIHTLPRQVSRSSRSDIRWRTLGFA